MKPIKSMTLAIFVTMLLNASIAQPTTLFPAAAEKSFTRPEKQSRSLALNQFVSQSFDLHDKVVSIRATLEGIHNGITMGNIDDLLKVIANFEKTVSDLQSIAPMVERVYGSSTNLLEKVKEEKISIIHIPLILKNFKAATVALLATVNDVKFMLATTVPGMRKLLNEKRSFVKDSISTQSDKSGTFL